jgi:hypothetical protein
MNNLIVIVGCEESQAVTKSFREQGFEAYSCDLKPCSGGNPDWHLQMDIFEAIKLKKPTLAILHPPCTYLTVTANKWLKDQPARESGALVGAERRQARQEAIEFFIKLAEIDVKHVCLENPVGCMSTVWRKPEQIIQPFQFGHPEPKKTCLWLKFLPPLQATEIVEPEYHTTASGKRMPRWYAYADKSQGQAHRAEIRSKTFPGIANAMAKQWGEFIKQQNQ